MSIEAEVFEQAKKRARRKGFLFALLLVFLVFLTLIIINSFLELERRGPHIARIKIDGPISDDVNFNRLIYDLGENPNVKALIVHINSPGGSVVGAESMFVALSQLSRSIEMRVDKKPILSDLRESGSIEQDADLVLMLSDNISQGLNQNQQLIELIVAKQRNGPTGIVRLKFNKNRTKFYSFNV